MTDRDIVRELWDRERIRDLLARYCRAVDRLDEELLRSVYFEDAFDDHGPFKGTREALIAWVIPFLRAEYTTTNHHLTTQIIRIDGDVAHVESYAVVVQDKEVDGRRLRCTAHSRYIDRIERRSGEWRIARRLVIADSGSTSDAPPWLGSSAKALSGGSADRDDPSYAAFPALAALAGLATA